MIIRDVMPSFELYQPTQLKDAFALLDRYGKRIASSELTPEQYWPAAVPPRGFLSRDERVDSEVVVRDPNATTASFELDVCLRSTSGALRCAGDAAVTATTGIAAP